MEGKAQPEAGSAPPILGGRPVLKRALKAARQAGSVEHKKKLKRRRNFPEWNLKYCGIFFQKQKTQPAALSEIREMGLRLECYSTLPSQTLSSPTTIRIHNGQQRTRQPKALSCPVANQLQLSRL